MTELKEWFDNIDAAAFSGDALYDPKTRAMFREFMARWSRAMLDLETDMTDDPKARFVAKIDFEAGGLDHALKLGDELAIAMNGNCNGVSYKWNT